MQAFAISNHSFTLSTTYDKPTTNYPLAMLYQPFVARQTKAPPVPAFLSLDDNPPRDVSEVVFNFSVSPCLSIIGCTMSKRLGLG